MLEWRALEMQLEQNNLNDLQARAQLDAQQIIDKKRGLVRIDGTLHSIHDARTAVILLEKENKKLHNQVVALQRKYRDQTAVLHQYQRGLSTNQANRRLMKTPREKGEQRDYRTLAWVLALWLGIMMTIFGLYYGDLAATVAGAIILTGAYVAFQSMKEIRR